MSQPHRPSLTRRTFLQGASALGVSTLFPQPRASAQNRAADFPTRVLGKTNQKITTLALGTWPCGRSSDVDVDGVVKLVHEALNLGINFLDTANAYGKAEEAIGIALKNQRDKVFLATKVWADTAKDAEKSLADSCQKLQTDTTRSGVRPQHWRSRRQTSPGRGRIAGLPGAPERKRRHSLRRDFRPLQARQFRAADQDRQSRCDHGGHELRRSAHVRV